MKLLISLLFFLPLVAFAQSNSSISLSQKEALKDLKILTKRIERIHPALFKSKNKERFRNQMESYYRELNRYDSLSVLDFYKIVGKISPLLKDGHTRIIPPKHYSLTNVFPLRVNINTKDSVITVQNDYSIEKSIPIGSQIISINNHSFKEITSELMSYVSGEKPFYRIHKLNTGRPSFQMLFNLLFHSSEYEVKYERNGLIQTSIIQAIEKNKLGRKTVSYKLDKNLMARFKPFVYYKVKNKPIGIIHVRSFMEPSYLNDFKSFLDSTFNDLENHKVKNLIIDFRRHGGGYSGLGDELLKYISPVPFQQNGKMLERKSIKRLFSKGGFEILNPFGYGKLEWHKNYELISPHGDPFRFHGEVFLLTSHSTFSSASDFSSAFQYFDMGTVIGEETGGMNISYGEFINCTLPKSKLRCDVSCKKSWSYGAEDDSIHGTIPDYEIPFYEALHYTIDNLCKQE